MEFSLLYVNEMCDELNHQLITWYGEGENVSGLRESSKDKEPADRSADCQRNEYRGFVIRLLLKIFDGQTFLMVTVGGKLFPHQMSPRKNGHYSLCFTMAL